MNSAVQLKFTALALAVAALGSELGLVGADGGNNAAGAFPTVFDLQPKGYAKLGAVEAFRAELLRSTDRTVLAYANTVLPTWWYVQDMEDFVEGYTPEQETTQNYCCSMAGFHPANSGDKWTFWWYAYDFETDEDGHARESVMKHTDGKVVVAVASDSRNASGTRLLKANPRIADIPEMIRRNQKSHWDRNHAAVERSLKG